MNTKQLDGIAEVVSEIIGAAVAGVRKEFAAQIEALKSEVAAAQSVPKDGRDGQDGANGKDCDMEAVKAMIVEAVKAIPAPADGKDGRDGKDGAPGEKGADGAGIADLLTDRDGALVATFTDGRMKSLGVIVGKDGRDGRDGEKGAPGQDGRDGLGFDDLAVEYDGEKTITLKMQRGDVVKEASIVLPINIDRGIFKEGQNYTAGDSVTWGGSYWIAQRDTGAKPDSADSGWRLAVKKGRDGKDGRNGIDKTAPVVLKD